MMDSTSLTASLFALGKVFFERYNIPLNVLEALNFSMDFIMELLKAA